MRPQNCHFFINGLVGQAFCPGASRKAEEIQRYARFGCDHKTEYDHSGRIWKFLSPLDPKSKLPAISWRVRRASRWCVADFMKEVDVHIS
jgi:hypothetical protein